MLRRHRVSHLHWTQSQLGLDLAIVFISNMCDAGRHREWGKGETDGWESICPLLGTLWRLEDHIWESVFSFCIAETGSTLQFLHFASFIVGLEASWCLDCHHFPSRQKSARIANVCHHTCLVTWLQDLDSTHQACIVKSVYPLNHLLGPDLIFFFWNYKIAGDI